VGLECVSGLVLVLWLAIFLITTWLHLPWFVFFASCCAVLLVGVLMVRGRQGARRREGLIYTVVVMIFTVAFLFLADGAPFRDDANIPWFFAISFALVILLIVLVFRPEKTAGKAKGKLG
jgi:hypothetical protein